MWARSSVRLEHRTFNPGVAGSTPVEPAYVHNTFGCLVCVLNEDPINLDYDLHWDYAHFLQYNGHLLIILTKRIPILGANWLSGYTYCIVDNFRDFR